MPDKEVLSYFEKLSPEARKVLLRKLTRSYGMEERGALRDLDRGEEMEDTPTPGMRKAGPYTIAANPLEHLGAGIRRYQGSEMRDAAQTRLEDMMKSKADAQQAAMQEIIERLKRMESSAAPQGAPQGAQPGVPPPVGPAPLSSPMVGGSSVPYGRGGMPPVEPF